jgi:hypothetical protein
MRHLRDRVTRFFASGFFIFPQAPGNNTSVILIFFKLRIYSQVKVHHRYKHNGCKFATGTTDVFDTSGKFATGVNNTLPPVSTTQVASCHRYQQHLRQICHLCQQIKSKSGQSRCKRVLCMLFFAGKIFC